MDDLKKSAAQALPRLDGSPEEWTTLLDLSVEPQLPEVRKTAIQKLTPTVICQNALDVIAMARKYQVNSWLKAGLQVLVNQSEFLSEAYEDSLGWRTIIKLCRLREDSARRQYRSYNYYSSSLTMESEFQDELKDMDD
jgi:hypothetical protein